MTARLSVLVPLVAGCFYVTERERMERWDVDGDGLERPADCDDEDPTVGGKRTFFADRDEDGFGRDAESEEACAPPAGFAHQGGDCDDADPTAFPGAPEQCDDRDDDCDGDLDEGLATGTVYADADADGFGSDATTLEHCGIPPGYAALGGDCDDAEGSVHPGAPEACNDVDDDCDGPADEDDPDFEPPSWYEDADEDGYGGPVLVAVTCDEVPYAATNADDCDDADADANPGAEELCNDVDDDCDDEIDVGATDMRQYYVDADADGYGDPYAPVDACPPDPPLTAPPGLASNASDCDDTDGGVNPAAQECWDNGVDEDCDNLIDETPC